MKEFEHTAAAAALFGEKLLFKPGPPDLLF
jgi:hypothetical protein